MNKNLVVIFFILLIACDDQFAIDKMNAPIVTGINITDEQGNIRGKVGYPNVRLNLGNYKKIKKSDNKQVLEDQINIARIGTYPNPSSSQFNIYFEVTKSSKVRISIVPANLSELNKNYNQIDTYIPNYREIFVYDFVSISGSHSIEIDVSQYESGFYKIFVETDSGLMWDNILVVKFEDFNYYKQYLGR